MMNKKIKILLYGANLWYLGEGMFGPLFAVFSERIGGNILDITWAWAVYLIVSGIMIMYIGRLSDKKFDKTNLMIIGYALNALATLGYLFVSTQAQFFLIQIILGVAAALAIPTWNALYAKYEDRGAEGGEWGLATGEAKILTGVATILGGLIVTWFSFTTLFFIMGLIQVTACVYQAQILRLEKKKSL